LHRAVIIKSVYNEEILVFALAENISRFIPRKMPRKKRAKPRDPIRYARFLFSSPFFPPRND